MRYRSSRPPEGDSASSKPIASLIVKRPPASRSSGEWSDDDYDVLENGIVVGRIFKEPAAPQGRP
jgi:hypothetical protein